jgi:asparagine synthase (glutamine-hydrolysing)
VCGIFGTLGSRASERWRWAAMADALAHRGPDDRGVWFCQDPQIVLGHLRLAILDLSPSGHQPMASPDGRVWVTYNGEVYNFRELRAELESRGHAFHSKSDTEVVLASYREWGLAAVNRFRGMFAFALWDSSLRLLHLCRDRFGVKPLYYSSSRNGVSFASEIKALHAVGETDGETDPVAIAEYVQAGYVTAPRTAFARVRAVRPGTILTFDERGQAKEFTYWSVNELFDQNRSRELRRELSSLSETALLDRVEEVLCRAFEYRMVADVPVGLFLSGGIDSSLVAAILRRKSKIALQTFTIGYGGSEYDETTYAREVASRLTTEHSEFLVSPAEMLALFERTRDIADEPIGDSSLIPTLMVSQAARRHVKVALSADGADELFGGYARYHVCGRYIDSMSASSRTIHWLAAETLDRLPRRWVARAYRAYKGRARSFAGFEDKLRKFIRMSKAPDRFGAYESVAYEWDSTAIHRLAAESRSARKEARQDFDAVRTDETQSRLMHFDAARYLPGDLLTKVDRASMSVSLEAREPFLDHELAELAVALPIQWKMRGRQNKYVLRRLLERHLPARLFNRPKHGFSAPVEQWLRGPLRETVLAELSSDQVRRFSLLDANVVNSTVSAFFAGRNGASPAGMWFLLQLQRWAARWLVPPRMPTRMEQDARREFDARARAGSAPRSRGDS